MIYRSFLQNGSWQAPQSHLFMMLGPLAVCMFFIMTGYLFFGQLLRTQGRPDWYRLYIGRIFRIGPLYALAVVAMLLLVFAS